MSRPHQPRSPYVPARVRRPSSALDSVEAELMAERASALGRAGNRLDRALAEWWSFARSGRDDHDERARLLDAVRDAAYALLVQRDCAGFRCDNLAWIRRHYDVPDAAMRRI